MSESRRVWQKDFSSIAMGSLFRRATLVLRLGYDFISTTNRDCFVTCYNKLLKSVDEGNVVMMNNSHVCVNEGGQQFALRDANLQAG